MQCLDLMSPLQPVLSPAEGEPLLRTPASIQGELNTDTELHLIKLVCLHERRKGMAQEPITASAECEERYFHHDMCVLKVEEENII